MYRPQAKNSIACIRSQGGGPIESIGGTYVTLGTGNPRSNAPFPAAEAGSVPVSSMEVKTAWMASPGDLTVH